MHKGPHGAKAVGCFSLILLDDKYLPQIDSEKKVRTEIVAGIIGPIET